MANIEVKFGKGDSIDMKFLNGEIGIPGNYGGYVIASGCGSGKTTVIKDIIRQKFHEGVLYAAATIKEVDEMYEWLANNVVGVLQPENKRILSTEDIIVLHSENEESKYTYRLNPDEITKKMIVLCTHHKLLHDDPRILIKQNFNISAFNNTSVTYIRDSVTASMDLGTTYKLPRQWILVDEMPVCDQLKAFFTKSVKLNLMEVVNNSVRHVDERGITVCDKVDMKLKGYGSYDETEVAYDLRVKGMTDDPFPESANTEDETKKSVPAQLRKKLLLGNFYENEASKTDTYDFNSINSSYVRYNISDFIISGMMTRLLVFDGTGDLTFGFNNKKFNLRNIADKYNSNCNFIKIDSNIARKFRESYLLDNENKMYSKLDECCNQLIDIINNNEKTLVVTWKDLKMVTEDKRSRSSIKLTGSNYNENFSLPEYITERLKELGVSKEFSVIHYQSGLDKATNEFREYDSIVFLGEFHVPNNVIDEFNKTYSSDTTLFRFTLYQLVQSICRTRIRNHRGESVNVYLTDDWDDKLIAALNVYLNYNRYDGINKIQDSLIDKELLLNAPNIIDNTTSKLSNKWRLVIENLDKTVLPGILDDIKYCRSKELTVDFNELHKVYPLKVKEMRKYYPLINYLRKFNINLTITK